MKSSDEVGVTFVNAVLGIGHLNGVVNITMGTYNFTPQDGMKEIDPDLVVSCRLRMDQACAQQLRDLLDAKLNQMAAPVPASPVQEKEALN